MPQASSTCSETSGVVQHISEIYMRLSNESDPYFPSSNIQDGSFGLCVGNSEISTESMENLITHTEAAHLLS